MFVFSEICLLFVHFQHPEARNVYL